MTRRVVARTPVSSESCGVTPAASTIFVGM